MNYLKVISYIISLFVVGFGFPQEEVQKVNSYLDVSYLVGNILEHNNNIVHLRKGYPEGILISWNRKTFGENKWEQDYNYPDYGVSFSYQHLKNEVLGNNYALYGHYNFYFLNRNLIFRIGQGLAFNTNPYDKLSNYKNTAFGSKIITSTYFMLGYKRERILNKFGLKTGVMLTHYSNGGSKAPNNGLNSVTFNLGVTYNLNKEDNQYITTEDKKVEFSEPIKFNIGFRTGFNEAFVGSGQRPFYVLSAYADKRLSKKSAIHLGTDVFWSLFLKDFIYHRAIAYTEFDINKDTDYKRVGVVAGHELFINKLSLLTQVGFYAYYPFDYEGRLYQRLGLKYYLTEKIYSSLALKIHLGSAEAIELGLGIRL